MNLPEIELDEIPGLPTKTGIYGSMSGGGGQSDDTIIVVMVFVYNNAQGTGQ